MKTSSKPNIFEVGRNTKPAMPSQVEIDALTTLFQQGRVAELEKQILRMTQQYPQHGVAWKFMGVLLRMQGKLAESLKPMQTACKLLPYDHEAFNNLGSTLEALKEPKFAEACYQRAIQVKPDYADGLLNLAHLLLHNGRPQEAAPLFERRLALTPDDDYVRHLVMSLRGQQSERATPGYVAKIFDNQADNFEAHWVEGLQYTVPRQLADLINACGQAPQGPWRVLDLGCGTGLMGVAIASRASELIGVDLSPKMLEKARSKGVYQSLLQADIDTVMKAEAAGSFDLITSADVFIHIGKIDEIVAEARRLLRTGGLMAFSVETLELPEADTAQAATEYRLKASGRYGQSGAYLARLAEQHGFKALSITDTTLRTEVDKPVPGQLVIWQAI
ncbi:MAG: methyltransferase domain-containing protein [Aquabacterium sp.]